MLVFASQNEGATQRFIMRGIVVPSKDTKSIPRPSDIVYAEILFTTQLILSLFEQVSH